MVRSNRHIKIIFAKNSKTKMAKKKKAASKKKKGGKKKRV